MPKPDDDNADPALNDNDNDTSKPDADAESAPGKHTPGKPGSDDAPASGSSVPIFGLLYGVALGAIGALLLVFGVQDLLNANVLSHEPIPLDVVAFERDGAAAIPAVARPGAFVGGMLVSIEQPIAVSALTFESRPVHGDGSHGAVTYALFPIVSRELFVAMRDEAMRDFQAQTAAAATQTNPYDAYPFLLPPEPEGPGAGTLVLWVKLSPDQMPPVGEANYQLITPETIVGRVGGDGRTLSGDEQRVLIDEGVDIDAITLIDCTNIEPESDLMIALKIGSGAAITIVAALIVLAYWRRWRRTARSRS